ncbi:MAG: XRE family transcriptional regulator [Candidatus Omnitrophica bacterium]|nr:XRE family transcriptional regulator [Candidatus Omnitrophota bacterium]
MDLGARIRALRKEQGLAIGELARRSGVAVGSLSRIENGKGGGNARTIEKIAEALKVSVAELYRGLEAPPQGAAYLESKAQGAQTYTYDEKASAILLTTQVSRKHMLPQMIVLQPGGKTAREQYPRGTERWLFGLEGDVDVRVGEESYRISQGSTLYLDASMPHHLSNANRHVAKLISVTNPVVL